MRILFEDNANSGISRLLLGFDDSIIFTSGSQNIYNEIRDSSEFDIIYYDVVPDNYRTVKGYNKLIDLINTDKLFKIVIPIPCIEYFCICCWLEGETQFRNILQSYWLNSVNYRGKALSTVSVEKFCKSFLNCYSNCLNNTTKHCGKFYVSDCLCSKIIDLCDRRLTLKEKCYELYSSLPLVIKSASNDNIKINSVEQLIKLVNQWYYFYDSLTFAFINDGWITDGADYSLRRLWWC